ncbi:MAG: LPS-assembly protein LptD [Terrimonas sp.]|nr:LPS-assembly protein LptD [Terrimonas sp.]
MLTTVLFFTQTWKTAAHIAYHTGFDSTLTFIKDTIPPKKQVKKNIQPLSVLNENNPAVSNIPNTNNNLSAAVIDTVPVLPSDSVQPIQKIDSFSLKLSKDSLDAPIYYEAEDSAVVVVDSGKVFLYGKTKTNYQDIELTAPRVEMDQETMIITAVNSKDSNGVTRERARFVEGEQDFQSDTIRYNMKTQKGLTNNTYTKSDEMYIQADKFKKIGTIVYASHGVITTCNYDDPHFGFRYDKIKIVNNKVAISGPIHPEFEKVPIPIYLPFGFFPLSKGRHSGLLPPQFTVNDQFGIGLEGIGYYKVLNDYIDIKSTANIYSYGGWAVEVAPSYRKLYRYSGRLSFRYQSTKFNFKGDPDFNKTKTFFVNWSHSVDSRARPGTSFSANVSAGSTKFNQYVAYSPNLNFQNQVSSSITYAKSWQGKPYNLTLSANHSQNNRTRLINLNLPNIGFSVSTLYPFQRKKMLGTPKWYEKLGIAYNGSFTNSISFYDTLTYGKNGVKPFLKYLLDTAYYSARHNIPITLSLPPILNGNVIISPGISYGQNWIQRTTTYAWNDVAKRVDTSFNKGLFIEQTASFSLGFSTAVYGTFQFKKSRIIALRHVVRPTIGFSYTPDLNKNYLKTVKVDTANRTVNYNAIGGGTYLYASSRKFAGMNFSIDNNLEMKLRSKKDTGENAIKKVKLIDGYGFTGNYNFLQDSLNLSDISFYLRSTLFEKINISASATLNPYQYDSRGFKTRKYAWQGGKFKPGRISGGSLSMSTSFQSKPKDPEKEKQKQKEIQESYSNDPLLQADQQRLMDYMQQNPNEFVDFNIDWNLNLSLSLYFSERLKPDYSGFEREITSSVNFSGGFNLSPKWKLSANGFYDLKQTKLQTFQLSIAREMHCWQMSINVTPVGPYRFFNISINPKASILQDLKINRTRSFYGQ